MTPSPQLARDRVAAAHGNAVVLFTAFTLSIVVYTGVGFLILKTRAGSSPAELPYPFYAAAAALAIGSIVIRRAQLHRMRLEIVATTRGVEGLIKHLLNATIIAAAIAEVIGVLALVVAFFGGTPGDVARLGTVALVISLYNYPRRSAWQQAVDYFSATLPASENKRGL